MKRKLIEFLVWLTFKLDPRRVITGQIIGKGVFTINWQKYVPNDGNWHYVSMNMSCWMLSANPAVLSKDEEEQVYLDGTVITDKDAKK